jgi:hypothetical protein
MSAEPAAPDPQKAKAAEIPASAPSPQKKGPLPGRAARHVFSPDTRTGRIVRPLVRTLGFITGFFALGLLTCYILLYQPAERKSRSAQAQLEQARQDLDSKQEELRKAAQSLVGSESVRQTTSSALEKIQARLALQQALTSVVETRLALAQKDNAAASLALNQAEAQIKAQMPVLQKLAAANPDNIAKVIDLARSDLNRDATLAGQDLQRLSSELTLLDKALQ